MTMQQQTLQVLRGATLLAVTAYPCEPLAASTAT